MVSFDAKPPQPTIKLSRDKKDDVRAVLEALTTTIEQINTRLSYDGSGRDQGKMAEYLQRINSSVQYAYQALNDLKKNQDILRQELDSAQANISKSVTETLQSFMAETRRMTQAANISAPVSAGDQDQVMQFVLGFEKRLQELIMIHSEEVELFKNQNQYLQKRLDAIDDKLASLKR